MKVIGIGETVLDIIFRDDKPLSAVPGGSTFNAMISIGRTVGRIFPRTEILMISEVGDDHVGDIVTGFMEENGVSIAAVTRRACSQTHISLAFLDADNNAKYEFYKDHAHAVLEPERFSDIEFHKDDIVLFGSYFAINPRIRNHTKKLLEAAHTAGAVIYYDINFRKNHLADIDVTLPFIIENCRLSDFVRGSDEDFGYLFGTRDPEEIYRDHISPLCSNFICTCGSRPTHIYSSEYHAESGVEPIETVSTIGAGDNFNAGFIYGLIRDRVGKDACRRLSPEEWIKLIRTAGMFSAEVCRSIFNYVGTEFFTRL